MANRRAEDRYSLSLALHVRDRERGRVGRDGAYRAKPIVTVDELVDASLHQFDELHALADADTVLCEEELVRSAVGATSDITVVCAPHRSVGADDCGPEAC